MEQFKNEVKAVCSFDVVLAVILIATIWLPDNTALCIVIIVSTMAIITTMITLSLMIAGIIDRAIEKIGTN